MREERQRFYLDQAYKLLYQVGADVFWWKTGKSHSQRHLDGFGISLVGINNNSVRRRFSISQAGVFVLAHDVPVPLLPPPGVGVYGALAAGAALGRPILQGSEAKAQGEEASCAHV